MKKTFCWLYIVFGYENEKKTSNLCIKKLSEEKNVDLLLLGEEGKRHYVFMMILCFYDHTLHRGRKYFCRYCLQAFNTEEMLKLHIKHCFKIKRKQRTIMPKEANMLNAKIRRVKLSHCLKFMQILKVF